MTDLSSSEATGVAVMTSVEKVVGELRQRRDAWLAGGGPNVYWYGPTAAKLDDKAADLIEQQAAELAAKQSHIDKLAGVLVEMQTKTMDVAAELAEARGIVRDIYWMALRYADGRQTYAPGMCNDALRKAYDGGWLVHRHQNDPAFARDGASPEYRSLEARATTAEAERDEARAENASLRRSIGFKALEGHVSEIHALKAERDELLGEKERLGAALRYYADAFCELGKHHECCGKLSDDECSGCKAVAALATPAATMRTGLGPRPCDCVRCDCGNIGDAQEVARWDERAAALSASPALENSKAGLAGANSKPPAPSSQSERIAVLEAFQAGLEAAAEYVERIGSYGHETAAYNIRMISPPAALAPIGEAGR